MKYQSEIVNEILKKRGHKKSSLHYQSECISAWIEEARPSYPKLCDYEGEWLNYINNHETIGKFPYISLTDVTEATVNNVVPYEYKSAILKGQTKYLDINTDTFYENFWKLEDKKTVNKTLSPSTGEVVVSPQNMVIEEFLPVLKKPFKAVGNVTNKKIVFYDENKSYIEGHKTDGTTVDLVIEEIPINAKYMRISIAFGSFEDVVFKTMNDEIFGVPNLELQSVKMPVLTTSTFIPMYNFLKDDGKENFTKLYTEFYEVTKDTFTFKQSGHYQKIGITTDNFEKEGKQTLERNKEYQFKIEVLENTLSIDMEIICKSKFTDGVKRIVGAGETPTYVFSNTITSEIPEDDAHGSGEMILFYLPSGYNGEVSFKVTIGDGNVNNIKTNILTVNEDVTLRSNGSVCDQLDLLTGKLTQRIDEGGEILTQEVVKTVDLNVEDQDGNTLSKIKPIEGTMHISTDGNPIKPTFTGEVPIEAITQNLASFIEE